MTQANAQLAVDCWALALAPRSAALLAVDAALRQVR
jgi:hypothetical protein